MQLCKFVENCYNDSRCELVYSEKSSVRHKNKQGIAYSVFPFGSSRQIFLVGEPEEQYSCQNDVQGQRRTVPDYPRQVRSLLENVKTVCEEQGFMENVAAMCHFFIANIGMRELVRQLAHEICPQILGAVTFVSQAPASGAVIALELWAISGKKSFAVCKKILECKTLIPGIIATAQFDGMRWFFGGGFQPDTLSTGAYNRSQYALKWLGYWLRNVQWAHWGWHRTYRPDQLLRTWIYQGHLLQPEGVTQRYKELNRARTDIFGKTKFLKQYLPKNFKGAVYPASTGIGADDFDVVISAVALDTKRKDVRVVPLENPKQTSAFNYDAVYSPQSPKFSRAMAVAVKNECLIFVSGTASITDSESQHIGDPEKQTEQTLDNIAVLIDGENLARHGLSGIASGLENFECVRIYIKRPSDLEVIQQVCQRRLPGVPTIYTIADICRPELLVEIEGVIFTVGCGSGSL